MCTISTYFAEAAGLPLTQMSVVLSPSRCPGKHTQHDEEGTGLAAYLAASEALVFHKETKVVLRCHVFWRCFGSWEALRFSDHRGLSPTVSSPMKLLRNAHEDKNNGERQEGSEPCAVRRTEMLALASRVVGNGLELVSRNRAMGT